MARKDKAVITKKEACKILGISYVTLNRWIKQGRVPTKVVSYSPAWQYETGKRNKVMIVDCKELRNLVGAKHDSRYRAHNMVRKIDKILKGL